MMGRTFAALCVVLLWTEVNGRTYDIRCYGAKGDGITKDTTSIQRAIDAANAAGGGTVALGPGVYVTGTIWLKSNVDFYVGPGATVLGSPDKEDYCGVDAFPQNSGYLSESSFGAHLILCVEQENVTLRGPGVIDGNSARFLLDPATGREWGFGPGKPRGGQGDIPFRPSQMIELCESRNVCVRELEIRNSTYWSLFVHGCEHVRVSGCWIHNERDRFHTHNGDGIDIDCSRYVTVSDCRIRTADDCITLRASGDRLKRSGDCAYVTVANCTLSSPCNCVRAGVGNGKVHDCVLSNIVAHDSRTAINFVSSWSPTQTDGVDFRNIRFANWTVDCDNFVRLYGGPLAEGVSRKADLRNVYFDGFSGCCSGKRRSEIVGCSAQAPIRNVYFNNVEIDVDIHVSNAENVVSTGGMLRIVRSK